MEAPVNQPFHRPVMGKEVMEGLTVKRGGVYVDGTLGLGGHAQEILKNIGPSGKLIGIDRDAGSLEIARENLKEFAGQCLLIHGNFCDLDQLLSRNQIPAVDGIVLDLGISSFQLDNPERGLSFLSDGPLDMRLNQKEARTAKNILNELPENELFDLIRDYGEERFARRIASNIVRERKQGQLETTGQLRDVVLRSLPRSYTRGKIHPATRTFQALRIAVNRELEVLQKGLDCGIKILKPQGRCVVIAFHSLEDRIVKQTFRHLAKEKVVLLITKKPLRPQNEEIEINARSRSARLRVVERI